ncbi:MAG: hypothetical protein IKT42_02600 [Clostridia bacterium]|nr:hypothetical protein [Clostridia bacterium]
MKRILALLVAMFMIFALTACDEEESVSTGESTGETTSAIESADKTEDSAQSSTEDKTEDAESEETTENTASDNTASTNGNDKYGSVGMTNAYVDNRQPGVQDSFVATPPKYTKDEFVAKIMAYINNTDPTESYLYGESDKIPKDEKKYVEQYNIKDFNEKHEFNLFLHKTNSCEGNWVTIEKWDYQFTDQVVYQISLNYTIACNTLAEVIAYAKNDAYRLAPFCELSSSQVSYALLKQGFPKTTAVSKLTDTDFEKLANGEYKTIMSNVEAGVADDYSCHFSTEISQLQNGQYEYCALVSLQIRNQ